MNHCKATLAALGAAVLLQGSAVAATPSGPTKTYRWVDKGGVVHFGDVVPAEYAAQGQIELNGQGVPVRETPRQLSAAEIAAAQQQAEEAAKRRQHDSFLLSTYTRVRDIEQLRDERLALIGGQMDIARSSMSTSSKHLDSLKERVRGFQPYAPGGARRMPDQLAEEIVRALKEHRSLQDALASRESEMNELRDQFDADIARFRELTAARTVSR